MPSLAAPQQPGTALGAIQEGTLIQAQDRIDFDEPTDISAPHLEVMEIYPAIQGEGPDSGTPCCFIRLQGCPVGCSWCDIKDSWPGKTAESRWMTVEEVLAEVARVAPHVQHVVLTGGEPLVQRKGVDALLHGLWKEALSVEIETSGTMPPLKLFPNQRYNVSPKMPSANAKIQPDPAKLKHFLPDDGSSDNGTIFKFVISNTADFNAAKALVAAAGIPTRLVYLMPQGVTAANVIAGQKWLTMMILEEWPLVKLTTRLHILAYGNERGT